MKNKALLFLILSLVSFKANACTRVVYTGENGIVITGRTMDWKTDQEANIWAFPRGIKRNGLAGKNSVEWTSKYGSVITSAFDLASVDGMNERGLVANILYLTESEYVKPRKWDKRKPLSISMWVQYLLDNYATVEEAVKDIEKEKIYIVTAEIPNDGRQAGLHVSISDSKGDSAIFEYIKGKLKIYHGKEYKVLTNSPEYPQQIAIANYWKEIGGTVFLPGTNRASDRLARASFYINAIPKTGNSRLAIASVFSVMNNVSVPIGITTPNEPNISTTIWRTVSDQKNRLYFFQSTYRENIFWVDLKDINFDSKESVKKLELVNDKYYSGDATSNFKDAKPFRFLPSL